MWYRFYGDREMQPKQQGPAGLSERGVPFERGVQIMGVILRLQLHKRNNFDSHSQLTYIILAKSAEHLRTSFLGILQVCPSDRACANQSLLSIN